MAAADTAPGPRFHTRAGRLTPYAFSCGYVEQMTRDEIVTRLWHEGACYHVRTHDHRDQKSMGWDSTNSLVEARRLYRRHCRYARTQHLQPMNDLDGAIL